MPKSSFVERLEQQGLVRDIYRESSGSREEVVLTPSRGDVETISASRALARRGLSLLKAKRAMEEMLDKGQVVVELPLVEDSKVLREDLRSAGVSSVFAASKTDS